MKKQTSSGPIQLGTAKARPGQKAWGQIHVREGRKYVRLPACVIHGARPGEHVVLLANQHGVELNGVEAIRRLCEEIDPKKLKGTVFAVPSANPRAAMLKQQAWIEDKPKGKSADGQDHYRNPYNMNFQWPGKRGGPSWPRWSTRSGTRP